jgi:hypothetical protein
LALLRLTQTSEIGPARHQERMSNVLGLFLPPSLKQDTSLVGKRKYE